MSNFAKKHFDSYFYLNLINPYYVIEDMLNILLKLKPDTKLISVREDRPYYQVILYLQKKIEYYMNKRGVYNHNENIGYRVPSVTYSYSYIVLKGRTRYHIHLIMETNYFSYLHDFDINLGYLKGYFNKNPEFYNLFKEALLYIEYKAKVYDIKKHKYIDRRKFLNACDSFRPKYWIEKKMIELLKEFILFLEDTNFRLSAYSYSTSINDSVYYTGLTISNIPEHRCNCLSVTKVIKLKERITNASEINIPNFYSYCYNLNYYMNLKRFKNYAGKTYSPKLQLNRARAYN